MHLASLDGKQDVSLARTCSNGLFAPGHLIHWRDGNLVAQPFDPRTGVSSGSATAIVEHASFDSLFSIAEFSVSAEGKLAYMAGDAPAGTQLVWCDRNGKVLGTLGETSHYKSVATSPDGLRVATDIIGGDETKILILEGRGTRTLKTLVRSDGGTPTWSPDGKEIYFTSAPNGPQDIHVMAADGSGEEREVVKFNKGQWGALFMAASPDGRYLAYVMFDAASDMTIYTVALSGDHQPQPFLHSHARESAPRFSPDGKWLAYESNRSGRNEVYISPFPTGEAQYQVSTSGGERPTWRHDGKEIYYREGLVIMAVEVNTKASLIELGTPKPLFELASGNLTGRYYDVAPDGRFLANTSPLSEFFAIGELACEAKRISGHPRNHLWPKKNDSRIAGRGKTSEDLDTAVCQIVSKAVASDEVIDIFSAAGLKKPDISILSDEFLSEVRDLPHKNLAIETLRKLLSDEIKAARKNLVQSRQFSEMLEESIRKDQNKSLQAAQIIRELIDLAKTCAKPTNAVRSWA